MRIGDVGAVSPIGDLLAFSLAILIVVSLIHGVGTLGGPAKDRVDEDWVALMMSVRDWVGFDPDNDGNLELLDPSEIDMNENKEFPLNGVATVIFKIGGSRSGYRFIDGSIDLTISEPVHLSLVHGCSVIVEDDDVLIPALMEISFTGGD